jgi:UDP-N-acetylglucosamine transferase subunit ALG13
MHTSGFTRLVEEMDRIAEQIDEEVVMQIGSTSYRPRKARWFAFATQDEMEKLCEQARIVVSHAGAGSVLTALSHKRPLVVMPRLRKHGEAIDDHQIELAEALSEAGVLLVAHNAGLLSAKLEAAASITLPVPSRSRLIETLRQEVVKHVSRGR